MTVSIYGYFIDKSEGGTALGRDRAEMGCKDLVISHTATVAAGAALLSKTSHALLHC